MGELGDVSPPEPGALWDESLYPGDEKFLEKRLAAASEKSDIDLGFWFANCLVEYHAGEKHATNARLVLIAITEIWRARAYELPPRTDPTRPEVGVLRGIGYHVGENGQDTEKRRLLIDYLIDANVLPAIKDHWYMAEWGRRRSKERYEKAINVMCRLAEEYLEHPLYEKAVNEWIDDIGYLKMKWGSLLSDVEVT